MGSGQSRDKLTFNRYLNGKGPPSLEQQAAKGINETLGAISSCQPEGQMTCVVLHRGLPGYNHDNTLQLTFFFPNGNQTDMQPHPGQPYAGQRLFAYLPDSDEGRKVFKLLEKAFNQKLLFKITTNAEGEDVITEASIPLKTQTEGGSKGNGYPDPDYLKTVRKVLKNNGIE